MSRYLGALVFVVVAVACGGSTDIDDESGGGTSAGGSSQGGKASGGSSSGGASGKATGGRISNGGRVEGGAAGAGGTIIIVGGRPGTGGTGVVDPDCPATLPMGECSAADEGLACLYDNYTNCLCYTQPPNVFYPCQRVDPTCPGVGGSGPVPPPDPSAGGVG